MIDIETKMHFSYDLEATFTEEERKANDVLTKIKSELRNNTYDITGLDYFENLVLINLLSFKYIFF